MKGKVLPLLVFVFLFFISDYGYAYRGKKNFIVLVCRPAGLFSNFDHVLSLCKFYDMGRFGGIEVDFREVGLYYDPLHGPNWWSYYCDPVIYGEKDPKKYRIRTIRGYRPFEIEFRTSRQQAFDLINKYISIHSDILDELEQFQEEHFGNIFVIGVHYRGTDKLTEAPRLPYERVAEEVADKIQLFNPGEYRIFIATDEEPFITYMLSVFGERVCFRDEAIRSSNNIPVHLENDNPYQCGRDALLDALLLSRCDILIRTSSNLSRWSTYFNPTMPVYLLSHRYGDWYPAPLE